MLVSFCMLASTYLTGDRWSRDVRLPSVVYMILNSNWKEKRDLFGLFLCVGKYISCGDRRSRDVRLSCIVDMILNLNWKEKRDLFGLFLCVGKYLSYRAVASQVLSARQSLTSVFGMGTGGPSALNLPTVCELNYVSYAHWKPNKRSIFNTTLSSLENSL